MPTLRDRVRETLSATEPNEREARADLDAVLSGSRRRTRRAWVFVLAPALATAAIVLYLAVPRGNPSATLAPAPSAASTQKPPQLAARGVHLYLRVIGEPEDRAIAIDLDSKGDL